MEHLEKIIVGLILFILTSVVAYLFRMRQLYAATPKLYRHAPISNAGSLCELIVFNKGNQAEESIQVALDPDLKVELLASNSSEISLDGATLKVDRLHKNSEVSAMLLVENGILDTTKLLSVSSKATKGKIFKSISDVPPNYALSFLGLAFLIGILPSFIYGFKAYESLSSKYVEYKLEGLHKAGWGNLGRYYDSDIRMSYSNQEFPIGFSSREKGKANRDVITFDIYNKTALPMEVTVNLLGPREYSIIYFNNAEVSPMSKGILSTTLPKPSHENPRPKLKFTIKSGEDFIYGIEFEPPLDNPDI